MAKTWQDKLNDERRGDGHYGCIVDDGWRELVLETDKMLSFLDPEYKIAQVKEKFGTMRYYFDTAKTGVVFDVMSAVASNSEYLSASICEHCGKWGELRTQHYYVLTLCDSCNEKRDAKTIEENKANEVRVAATKKRIEALKNNPTDS